jgi:hypothetical protein
MSRYKEGMIAYENGKDVTDNPYPHGTYNYDEWQAGWDAAQEIAYNEGN